MSRRKRSLQLDLFGWQPPARLRSHHERNGFKVKLDRPQDRRKPCCSNAAVISAPPAVYGSELLCADCGRYRGWASKPTADRANEIAERFGAMPIIK